MAKDKIPALPRPQQRQVLHPRYQYPTLFWDPSKSLEALFVPVWNLFISPSSSKDCRATARTTGAKTTKLANIPGRQGFISEDGKDYNCHGILRQNLALLPQMEWKRSRASQRDGYPRPPDNGRDKNLRHTFANTPFRGILCNHGSVFLAIVWLFKSRAIRTRRRQAPQFRERN